MSGIRLYQSQNTPSINPDDIYIWNEYSPVGVPSARDGSWGFSVGGDDYVAVGWFGGSTTTRQFFKSTNDGNNWTLLGNVPFTGRHTVASFNLPTRAYVVGGDVFNIVNDGQYAKDSWVYDGTSWTQLAVNSGIGDRCLMGAVYHNGAFYLVGGQKTRYAADGVYSNVLRSTDDCVSFSQIGGATPFTGGNLWGSVASYKGRIWKVCGGIYDDANLANRTYPKEIYSSADGITWAYETIFPGQGRQYHQTFVWENLLWVVGGSNTTNAPSGYNLNDTWYSDNGVDWVQSPSGPFIGLHAHTCWIGTDGNVHSFGGSTNPYTVPTNKYYVLNKNLYL